MARPTWGIRDRWVQDGAEDREVRDLREQPGRCDLSHDPGTRDLVDDLGRREIERLGSRLAMTGVLPVPASVSGGILTRTSTRKTRPPREARHPFPAGL